jgi:hypothetical protein
MDDPAHATICVYRHGLLAPVRVRLAAVLEVIEKSDDHLIIGIDPKVALVASSIDT